LFRYGVQGRARWSAGTEGASWRGGLIASVKLSGRRTLYLGISGKSLGTPKGQGPIADREESLRLVDRGRTASCVCASLVFLNNVPI